MRPRLWPRIAWETTGVGTGAPPSETTTSTPFAASTSSVERSAGSESAWVSRPRKSGPVTPARCAVLRDRLRHREDVGLVEAPPQRRAAVARGPEGDPLRRDRRDREPRRRSGGAGRRDVDEQLLRGGLPGERMGHAADPGTGPPLVTVTDEGRQCADARRGPRGARARARRLAAPASGPAAASRAATAAAARPRPPAAAEPARAGAVADARAGARRGRGRGAALGSGRRQDHGRPHRSRRGSSCGSSRRRRPARARSGPRARGRTAPARRPPSTRRCTRRTTGRASRSCGAATT